MTWIECAAESILQFSDRKRRIRRDLARELGRGRYQLFMWHHARYEPNLQRSIGIDDVAGERQSLREYLGEQLRLSFRDPVDRVIGAHLIALLCPAGRLRPIADKSSSGACLPSARASR